MPGGGLRLCGKPAAFGKRRRGAVVDGATIEKARERAWLAASKVWPVAV